MNQGLSRPDAVDKENVVLCDQIALHNMLSSFYCHLSYVLLYKDVPKAVSDLLISFRCRYDSRQAMFKPLDAVPFDCVLPLELYYLSLSD